MYRFREVGNMDYLTKEMDALKNMVSGLTFDERSYIRYLRMKENGKKHWINKKHPRIG